MNTRNPILIQSLVCLFFISHESLLNAQEMSYAYDASGNRIKKELTFKDEPNQPGMPRVKDSYTEIFAEGQVKIFPNPASQFINIELPETFKETTYAKLLQPNGKIVNEQRLSQGLSRIELMNIEKGVYFLQIIYKNEISTWKIIKN